MSDRDERRQLAEVANLRMWVCDLGHACRGVTEVTSCGWTDGTPAMKGGFCGATVTEVAPIDRIAELEAETERLKNRVVDLSVDKATLEAENAELGAENAALKADISELEITPDEHDLAIEIERLTKIIADLRAVGTRLEELHNVPGGDPPAGYVVVNRVLYERFRRRMEEVGQ